jgi:hypothetical protein
MRRPVLTGLEELFYLDEMICSTWKRDLFYLD